ncbi:MAG: hypothetical protein H5T92_00125 [Synergistales bacterium]|jgi:hypothetical protein|nr:hypothetical protein [Synergistales bacterium]
MLLAYALAGAIMLIVALTVFGPVGLVAWILAMIGAYWYAKKEGWL